MRIRERGAESEGQDRSWGRGPHLQMSGPALPSAGVEARVCAGWLRIGRGRVLPWALQVGLERSEGQHGFEGVPQDLDLEVSSDRL